MKHIQYSLKFLIILSLIVSIPCSGAAKSKREEMAAEIERRALSSLVHESKKQIQEALAPARATYERAEKVMSGFKHITEGEKKIALDEIAQAFQLPKAGATVVARVKKEVSAEQAKFNKILEEAIKNKSPQSIERAFAQGADPDALIHGEPALIPIFRKDFNIRYIDEIMRAFKRNGVNIDAQSDKGYTALMRALVDDINFVEPVLKFEPNVNIADDEGNTALHYAVKSQRKGFEFIPELIKRGADVNGRNKAGESPLILAAKREIGRENKKHTPNEQAIAVLIQVHANPLLRDASGKEAIDYLDRFPELKKTVADYRQEFLKERQSVVVPREQKKDEKVLEPAGQVQQPSQLAEIVVEA